LYQNRRVASVYLNTSSEDRVRALESSSKSGNRNEEKDDQVTNMGLVNFASVSSGNKSQFPDFLTVMLCVSG